MYIYEKSINRPVEVWGHCICCAHVGPVHGSWLERCLSNYGEQIISFFKHIVHFYINVAACNDIYLLVSRWYASDSILTVLCVHMKLHGKS